MDLFTAKDIHTCFPWISGTTLYDRIKAGLIPVHRKPNGPGDAFELTLEQIVHVGVQDELAALGAWRAANQLSEIDIEFIPEPGQEEQYNRHRPEKVNEEPVYYYGYTRFACQIIVDIQHFRIPKQRNRRLKRSSRVFHIKYEPDPQVYPGRGFGHLGCHVFAVDLRHGEPLSTFSSAVINVYRIADHCNRALGLTQEDPEWLSKVIQKVATDEGVSVEEFLKVPK